MSEPTGDSRTMTRLQRPVMPEQIGPVTLHLGDCLEVMHCIPDDSVDMVLCDLPYGTTECIWDSIIPLEPLWHHWRRLITPRGAIVLTAAQPFTTTLIANNMPWFKYCWVWRKTKASDFINAKNKPMRIHEDIVVFSPGTTANRSLRRMTYNPQGLRPNASYHYRPNPEMKQGHVVGPRPSHVRGYWRTWENYPTSVLDVPNPNNGAIHPTQKPVALFAYLIRTYTNPGDTVLDNCIGSGTTAVACLQEGRHCIGIERDATYYGVARDRVQAAYAAHEARAEHQAQACAR